MVARQDPHHFAALGIDPDVRSQGIHHVDRLGLRQFPRPRREGIGLGRQRPDRTEVDDIALQVRIERLVQIGRDFGILAPPCLAHLGDPGHLGREAHAPRARDAARHLRLDKRAKIQILARPFGLAVAAEIHAIGHRLILKIALAALVADRTVERVVDQQKLHHALAGLLYHGRVGLHHRRFAVRPRAQVAHLHGAACRGLRRATDHLDKAHPAVARDRQPFVVAEPRDFDPGHLCRLDDRHRRIDLDHDPVNRNCLQIRHTPRPYGSAAPLRRAPMPAPRVPARPTGVDRFQSFAQAAEKKRLSVAHVSLAQDISGRDCRGT